MLYLEQLKQGIHARTSAAPSPTQHGPSNTRITSTSEAPERNRRPGYDDPLAMTEDGEPAMRNTEEYVDVWHAHIRDKNKENAHSPGHQQATSGRSVVDQTSHGVSSRNESQDNDSSYDTDFQEDQRNPDRNRNAPNAQHASPRRPSHSPPEMVRHQLVDGGTTRGTVLPKQQRTGASQARAGGRASGYDRVEQEEDPEEVNNPARVGVAQMRVYKPQVRTKWSEEDTDKFIELIGDDHYGTRWAGIARYANEENIFRTERDQGALKDKARNIKIALVM